jgi:hypothetical protein
MRDFISSLSHYIGARFGPGNAEQSRTPACTIFLALLRHREHVTCRNLLGTNGLAYAVTRLEFHVTNGRIFEMKRVEFCMGWHTIRH